MKNGSIWGASNWPRFGNKTHDEHAEDSASYAVTESLARSGTGTWVNDRSGISTSGVNGTFLYSASGSKTASESGSSSGCYTLHETGSYADGSWSLGCMVLDESGQFNSAYSYSGGDSASNTTGFSIAGNFSGAGSDSGSMSLHEEGSYSNGTWNFGQLRRDGERAMERHVRIRRVAEPTGSVGCARRKPSRNWRRCGSRLYPSGRLVRSAGSSGWLSGPTCR